MKKIFLLFLLIATGVTAQDNITLRGSFPAVAGKVSLLIDKNYLFKNPVTIEKEFTGNDFTIGTRIEKPTVVRLVSNYFGLPLYMEPNSEIHVGFVSQGNDQYGIQLKGKGAEQNMFLQRFFGQFALSYNDSANKARMLSMSIDQFESAIFNDKKQQLAYVKNDSAASSFSPSFNAFITNEINYHYWQLLYTYPINRANQDTKILTVTPIPDLMLENFSSVKVSNPDALMNESYREFLKYYIIYSTSKLNGFNKFTDYAVSADRKTAVAKEKLQNEVYAYWLARFTIEECEKLSPYSIKKQLELIKAIDKEKLYSTVAENICTPFITSNAKKAGTEKSEPTAGGGETGLTLTDLEGKKVSLSDFKGKVVYIDFWASWCGPCRAMMPASKQMHAQLSEKEKKQIVFLYISIDADENAWRKGIKDMQIEGVNVISPGNWKSDACSYFQINSIPRYMIMNKNGDIVEFNAKRPIDPSLLEDLRKLAGQ